MAPTTETQDTETGVPREWHTTSWSMNLEMPEYETDRERLVIDALDAVRSTAEGRHVNLVTHAAHGHPASYLLNELAAAFGDAVSVTYVNQCGCGGHVTRVTVNQELGQTGGE